MMSTLHILFLCICIFLQSIAIAAPTNNCGSIKICSSAENNFNNFTEATCCSGGCAASEKKGSEEPSPCSKNCQLKTLNNEDLWVSNQGKRLINYVCGGRPRITQLNPNFIVVRNLLANRDASSSRLSRIVHFGVRLI